MDNFNQLSKKVASFRSQNIQEPKVGDVFCLPISELNKLEQNLDDTKFLVFSKHGDKHIAIVMGSTTSVYKSSSDDSSSSLRNPY